MEMHQVRYFLAVAETLNFTRAAGECNVAQPSLTRAIRQLEEELGGDLFRRERPHAQLTDLGQRMRPLLQQCYESALGARSLALSIKSGEVGSLRIALSATVETALVMPYILELRKHFQSFDIITEASDFDVARRMGVNYAPKLTEAIGSPGVQNVTLQDGVMKFAGNADFSPTYKVVAGDPPGYFPPKVANPGGVADDQWSSIVVLPSGLVLNAQIVQNDSGKHNRLKAIDTEARTATLSILDGVQGGKQYFYHLVTDASAAVPAVLEKGVFAPRLAKIPQFGQSLPGEKSALLGFSPVLNGRTDKGSGEDQGFSTALGNDIDPINVFPIGPDNDNRSRENNYSPLWDAHVSMWTQAAVDAGKVHRIHSMDEQKSLIREGLLTSASINPPGTGNPYVGGLRPTQAIINCPVIAHPDLPPQ